MLVDTSHNSSFSKLMPGLMLAWDSTSLGLLKECPRKYQYSIVEGWEPRGESIHLTFGRLFHAALERYDHAKFAGADHEESQRIAVRYCMESTWDKEKRRPSWLSDDSNKNRFTLTRTVSWYLEEFKDDPVQTVRLDNGKPAVELSFRFETSYTSVTGEKFLLCGHLDRVGTLNDDTYILDRKTSKSILNRDFFTKFSPDNQFSLYVLAGRVAYSLPVRGLIVDAAQVAVTFSRFERGFISRTESQLEEYYKDVGEYLLHAQRYAEQQYWPINEKSCGSYGGCPFRKICSRSPETRETWLKAEFNKRTWDPLQVRGDI